MTRRGAFTRVGALALAHPAPFLERRIRTMTDRAKPRILRSVGSFLVAAALVAVAGGLERPEARAETVDLSEMVLEHRVDEGEAGGVAEAPQAHTRTEKAPAEGAPGAGLPGAARSPVAEPEPPTQEAPRPGRISGRVSDAQTGAPLADVQVYLVGANIGAITRQNGAYVILNVPAGTYELRAERIGLSIVTHEVTVSDDAMIEVNFELTAQARGLDEILVTGTAGRVRRADVGAPTIQAAPTRPGTGRITGRVVDVHSGAPVADVQVYLAGVSLGAVTRQNGAYVILNVPPGTYEIRAERIGLTTVAREVTIHADGVTEERFELEAREIGLDEIVVTGTAGQTRRQEVAASRTSPDARTRLSGQVLDAATGAPVADVQVVLVGANMGGITRQNGTFLILDPPAGTHRVRIERLGIATMEQEVTVHPGQVTTVSFRTRPESLGAQAAADADIRLLPTVPLRGEDTVTDPAARRTSVAPSPTTARIMGVVTDAATGEPLPDVPPR
jgi:5-hydroxyisourate hydrolase-like protein (transthyretin family)